MSVEVFMRNKLNGDRVSNYEIMKEQARQSFASLDMDEISRRTGVMPEGGFFRVRLLCEDYLVSTSDGSVTLADGSPSGSSEAMIIYDLLGCSKAGAFPSGNYTQIQNLSGAFTSTKYTGQGMFTGYEKRLSGRSAELDEACRKLEGVPWGKGDVSYTIPVWGRLRAAVSFWDADDEFPASLNLLMDERSTDFMHYETLWYLAGVIADRIMREIDG